MSDKKVQVGVFRTLRGADAAVAELVEAGFEKESVTVICPTCSVEQFEGTQHQEPAGSHTPRAIATGGAIGMLLGGLGAAALTATGGAALLIAGPIFGATAAGGVVGSLIGAMMTRGLEPEVADFYDQALQKGSILVAVEAAEGSAEERTAHAIFERTGSEAVELPKT
jgi:hypothetical protein